MQTGRPLGVHAVAVAAQPVPAGVDWPPALPNPSQPGSHAYSERVAELADLLMSMWFASWMEKRAFVERVPDLADRNCHMLSALMIRETPLGDEIETVVRAHLPLLERCQAAFVASRRGGPDYATALDEVFDDHLLWLPFRDATGQPLE